MLHKISNEFQWAFEREKDVSFIHEFIEVLKCNIWYKILQFKGPWRGKGKIYFWDLLNTSCGAFWAWNRPFKGANKMWAGLSKVYMPLDSIYFLNFNSFNIIPYFGMPTNTTLSIAALRTTPFAINQISTLFSFQFPYCYKELPLFRIKIIKRPTFPIQFPCLLFSPREASKSLIKIRLWDEKKSSNVWWKWNDLRTNKKLWEWRWSLWYWLLPKSWWAGGRKKKLWLMTIVQ